MAQDAARSVAKDLLAQDQGHWAAVVTFPNSNLNPKLLALSMVAVTKQIQAQTWAPNKTSAGISPWDSPCR